ncbi:MAG: CPBP family intramembrane metalloprotease [Chloroflexi bacterium]|jgi:membrane protease YdiL (CAAX protease family)|nr:CPBP family intramembrane metalloprotease [Chloroflexota bacterium]
MNITDKLEQRRLYLYLAISFGIAWATFLAIYLTGGLVDSPMVFPEANVSLALILLAGPVMSAPAIAHLLTRIITREGWRDARLRPRPARNWRYWAIAWLAPGILTLVGMAIFFWLFPRYYDPSLSTLRQMIEESALSAVDVEEANLWYLIGAQIFQAILISPVLNSLATFGEEFGWRAYLQPKLMPLGRRRAYLLTGVIWGIWHWPAIAMGHNYGFAYPGAPITGILMMIWFCITLGILLGWLTDQAQSVWPAVIAHGAINGIAGLSTLFMQGNPNPLLGPMPVGIIGNLGFTIVALVLFFFVIPRETAPSQDTTSA